MTAVEAISGVDAVVASLIAAALVTVAGACGKRDPHGGSHARLTWGLRLTSGRLYRGRRIRRRGSPTADIANGPYPI